MVFKSHLEQHFYGFSNLLQEISILYYHGLKILICFPATVPVPATTETFAQEASFSDCCRWLSVGLYSSIFSQGIVTKTCGILDYTPTKSWSQNESSFFLYSSAHKTL